MSFMAAFRRCPLGSPPLYARHHTAACCSHHQGPPPTLRRTHLSPASSFPSVWLFNTRGFFLNAFRRRPWVSLIKVLAFMVGVAKEELVWVGVLGYTCLRGVTAAA